MLTKAQIVKRLGCENFDAAEVLKIQARGKVQGFTGADEDENIAEEIEQIENLMFADAGAVRAIFDAAVREGAKAKGSKKKAA